MFEIQYMEDDQVTCGCACMCRKPAARAGSNSSNPQLMLTMSKCEDCQEGVHQ